MQCHANTRLQNTALILLEFVFVDIFISQGFSGRFRKEEITLVDTLQFPVCIKKLLKDARNF
jgi:hypothetical protein